jgi:hypothetical protein
MTVMVLISEIRIYSVQSVYNVPEPTGLARMDFR